MWTQSVLFILISVLLVAPACDVSSQAPNVATPVPIVDTDQIVQAVLAEVESQLGTPGATSLPEVDADAIAADVLAQVESQLEQNAPPNLDTEQIAEVVLAKVSAELDEQSKTARAAYNELAATITGTDVEEALIRVYQQANPAVVYIVVPSVGSGSGFVTSAEGHIVTNSHVVEGGREYEVVFANGERRSANLIGSDIDSDLAVIQVDDLPAGVGPLPLAESDDIRVGQLVVAIGNPFGEQGSMSLGIISALGRSLPSQRATPSGGAYSLPQVIQTDAPINPGNSGGPLLNLDGAVVGVNSAIASTTGTNSGVGFSIPVAAVRQVTPSLVEKGEYVYPYMGASFDDEVSLEDQSVYGLSGTQGAYVVDVTADGPADDAGLVPANPNTGRGGDFIVEIDGQPINSFSDLNSYLVFHTRFGQTIELTVLRGAERIVLPLTLGARP